MKNKIKPEQKALIKIKIILNDLILGESDYSPEDYLTDIELILDKLDKKVLANKDLTYIKKSVSNHFEKVGRKQKSNIGLLFEKLNKYMNKVKTSKVDMTIQELKSKKIDVENTMPYSEEENKW